MNSRSDLSTMLMVVPSATVAAMLLKAVQAHPIELVENVPTLVPPISTVKYELEVRSDNGGDGGSLGNCRRDVAQGRPGPSDRAGRERADTCAADFDGEV